MWAIYGLLSALMGGINGIVSKISLRKADIYTIIALRTVVAFLIAWGAVWWGGLLDDVWAIDRKCVLFLALSGVATASAWYFYFAALRSGPIYGVAAVDKMSIVIVIIGGWIWFGEGMSVQRVWSMILIVVGALLMMEKKSTGVDKHLRNNVEEKSISEDFRKHRWLAFSFLSVLLVSASILLSKIGVESVDSRLAFAIRTTVVLIVSACVYALRGFTRVDCRIKRDGLGIVCISGVLLAVGWLFYFKGLSLGKVGALYSIDKLSIFVTVALSSIFYRRTIIVRVGIGLLVLCVGITMQMII